MVEHFLNILIYTTAAYAVLALIISLVVYYLYTRNTKKATSSPCKNDIKVLDTRRIDDDTVRVLEAALAQAKKGEYVAVGLVFCTHNHMVGNDFTTNYPSLLLGETVKLQREIIDCGVELRLHQPYAPYGD